jgi:hypothetical protein
MSTELNTTKWWGVSIWKGEVRYQSLDVVKETQRFLTYLSPHQRELQRVTKRGAFHSWHPSKRAALEEAFAEVDALIASLHKRLVDATNRIEAIKAALDALPDEEEAA